jgi:hypothetical protein
MKNPFKKKAKHSIPEPQVPRSKEDLDKVISELVTKIGLTEYEIFVRKENIKTLMTQGVSLAREQEARKALDAREELDKEIAEEIKSV